MVFMLQRYSFDPATGDHAKINAYIDIYEKINFISTDFVLNLNNFSKNSVIDSMLSPDTKFENLRCFFK